MVRYGVETVLDCPADFTLTLDENWTAEALGNILRNCAEHASKVRCGLCACTTPSLMKL